MTIASGPRFKAAVGLIEAFAAGARPKPGKTPAETAKRAAALQRSPAGWPVTRNALADALRRRMTGKDLPRQVGTSYCGPAA